VELILIRHGETIWNKERRTQGFSDIELTETGLTQARLLSELLSSRELQAVYSSPLKRAVQTAEKIADPHGLQVQHLPGLMELNQGDLEGLTFQELRANHSQLLKDWLESPAHLKMPGGESLQELQDRGWPAIEHIFQAHREGAVAVVSHNLCITTILCKLLNIGLDNFRRIRQNNGAINIIENTEERGMILTLMNDTCHLNGMNTM
jgi:broad specificity phosphatase PhoE